VLYFTKQLAMNKASQYPKHSIAEHIVPFDLVFGLKDTVSLAIKKIEKEVSSWPNIEHLFIIDENRKLLGTVEFAKLLENPPETKLQDLANERFTFVTKHSHQSKVAKIALKLGVENIPVVDEEGHFVGIIDATEILKILHEEHVEKLMHFSGILNNEAFVEAYKSKVSASVRSRLPWLVLGLAGGILSTFIIQLYDHTLEAELSLAFFIPLVVYINAAVGYQTQTIFVRLGALEKIDIKKALFYELKVGLIVATLLSLGLFILTSFWINMKVSEIVALSMFVGIMISIVLATLIPWLLQKTGRDPAVGSGPFATILQDLISVVIYFSIASYLL